MPANKEALIRYRIIDGCLRNKQKPYPSLEDLALACEEVLGTVFSTSTIQKDIYALRFDQGLNYNAPIEYSRLHNGYQYTDPAYTISSVPLKGDEINAIEFAAGILEQFKGTDLHDQFDSAVEKILQVLSIRKILRNDQIEKIIQVEKASYFKGTEHLSRLMDLIKKSKVISFNYNSFERGEPKKHLMHPYLLKEYRNRWYLVGYHPEYNDIRTFGVDRISDLKELEEHYVMAKDFDPSTYFQHSIGVTSSSKPEEVVLSFSPFIGKYIKTQTLHHSQKVMKDNDKEFRISIFVTPCHELEMQILSYGEHVRVIKPTSLADKIKTIHQKAAEQYERE